MAVTINAKGTSNPHFKIGKQGTTIYQGSSDPTGSYTTSAGDVWIDTTNLTLTHRNSGNSAWVQGSIDITGNATISGNLTINGTTTILDTTNITVEDPLMLLSSGASGSPSADAGFVIERGSSTNVGIIWDESADEFAAINTTEAGSTAGNVSIASYANIRADEYYGDGSNLTGVVSTLSALTDTTISSPADDQFLRYNGSAWINEAVTLTSTISALTDTTVSSLSSGQVLKYNGSAWVNTAEAVTTTVTLSEMTGDASDTTLTLESTPTSDDNLLVFVDSVLQDAGAWSRSGTTLTFSEAPASGAVIKAWDLVSSTATNAAKLDALTADSSTTAFTLQQGGSTYTPSHANCLLVSVAGVMQEPGSGKAFTVSGSTLTFSTAPTTGATIWIVDVGSGITANTPADDSVTSAKIVDGAIVNADINASAAVALSKLSTSGTANSTTFLRGDGAWSDDLVVLLDNVRNDISTLALHSAITDNKAAYNLSNAFIDQFEDDTGIDAETSCDRASDEYMSTISGVGGIDSYTVLMLHADAGGTSITFVDSSTSPHTMTASDSSNPNQQGSGATIKFGASSGKWNNVSYLSAPDHADWHWGSDDWTIDFWLYHPQHCSTDHFDFVISQPNATGGQSYFGTRRNNAGTYYMMGNSINSAGAGSDSFSITLNEWNHYAICQHGDYQYHYKDGVSVNGVGVGKSSTVAFADLDVPLRIGYQQDVEYYNGWADEIRISKGIARYPSGTSFTPFTTAYDVQSANATGSFTCADQTAVSAVTSMGIVILYKNDEGTATLNTDLIAELSANGGTNYTTATLTAGGTFSTGISIATVSGVTVTSGTAPKYRISWANQSSGSKVTQVHGAALLY